MPFPLSAQGAIEVPLTRAEDAERLIKALETALRNESASEMSRHANELTFRGGIFRLVSNWNQLVAITSGLVRFSFSADHARIEYRITFTQMLALVPAMLAFFCLPALSAPRFEFPPWPFFVLIAAWLFGGNYFMTRYRFPRFLRRAAQTVLN